MKRSFYSQFVQHIIKKTDTGHNAYRFFSVLITGSSEGLLQRFRLWKRNGTPVDCPQYHPLPSLHVRIAMPVKTVNQHPVAGIKKGRFQVPALFAECLFGAAFSRKNMTEKIRYSILRLRFMALRIININTGKVNIRRRVKSLAFSTVYLLFSAQPVIAVSINLFISFIIATFASAIGLFTVYHFLFSILK
jgi:hypothetical protein